MGDQANGVTIPGQYHLWKNERNQVTEKYHQYSPMEWHGTPKPLLALKELCGQAGYLESLLPVAISRSNEEYNDGHVGKCRKKEKV
jgi:hypothetical protein